MADSDLLSKKEYRNFALQKKADERKRYIDLIERGKGISSAKKQARLAGPENIETEPDFLERVFTSSTKSDPYYQGRREMKKAIESERARINIPQAMQEESDMQKRLEDAGMKKGGKVKKMAKGGATASKRADGIATKGKTRGRII